MTIEIEYSNFTTEKHLTLTGKQVKDIFAFFIDDREVDIDIDRGCISFYQFPGVGFTIYLYTP